MKTFDLAQVERDFRAKLVEFGLDPPDGLTADGKIHRIDSDGKRGGKDGFYVLHTDGVPAGAYGDWHGGKDSWQTWCACDLRDLSPLEYAQLKDVQAQYRKAREAAEAAMRAEARARAKRIWEAAEPTASHPYLSRKGVQSYGLRQAEDGRIVVPMVDSDGQIHSLQFIAATKDAEGKDKKFLQGGTPTGHWFWIGKPGEIICIAEGYATGASVHAATGYAVAVAFDCGNIRPVALAIREKYPEAKIILCADDDHKTKDNPGKTKAEDAAVAINGVVAIPDFGVERAERDTDFNDLQILRGIKAISDCIDEALMSAGGPIDAADLFPLVMREIQARKEGKSRQSLHTGIGSVDRLTGGLRRGYVTVIAALPSRGKTAAVVGILAHNAAHGVPCLLFSIEMDRQDIGVRFLSVASHVPAVDINDERQPFGLDEWTKLTSATGSLETIPLTVDDRPLTMAKIIEESHRWFAKKVKAAGHEMGLVAIDYLGLIRSDEGSENRNREVAHLSRETKRIAKALRTPVILVAQLNREAAKRGGDPQMSDLRDSGEIEANADMIIFPHPWPRDELGRKVPGKDVLEERVDKWIVDKNRNGKTGAALVNWNPQCMHFTGLERESPEWRDDESERTSR
jgi:phage/plasmid primase-like uncharacterized protein/replicative DNA helicase